MNKKKGKRMLSGLLALVLTVGIVPVTSLSVFAAQEPENTGAVVSTSGAALQPLTPEMPVNPFSDVKGTDWFIDDVIYVYNNGLMSGTSAEPMLFSPDQALTRGMVVASLYRYAGSPDVSGVENAFSDVADGKYYTDAVKWAAENNIVSGYDGKFMPEDAVTRQDLAVMLMRCMDYLQVYPIVTMEYVFFADEADIADYAKNAIQTLNKLDVISGMGNDEIYPTGYATRAQAAAMLHRFAEVIEER